MDLIFKALPYIINIFSGCILAVATYNINRARSEKQEQEKKQKALEDGVQCLLRNSIVTDYNKYQNKGFCPIYAKESLKKVYHAYHDLGGNDVATDLYDKMLKMPTERGGDEQ